MQNTENACENAHRCFIAFFIFLFYCVKAAVANAAVVGA